MASANCVRELRQISTGCIGTSIEELVSRGDLGKLDFKEVEPDLERVFSIFKDFLVLPVDFLSDTVVEQIIECAKKIFYAIDQIRAFDLNEEENPKHSRKEIVSSLKKQANDLCEKSCPWIPYIAYKRGDIQQYASALSDAAKESERILADAKEKIKNKTEEISNAVAAAKKASAAAGVAVFTNDFADEADRLKNLLQFGFMFRGVLESRLWPPPFHFST